MKTKDGIWVYNKLNYNFVLLENQPFKSKWIASELLKISSKNIDKYLSPLALAIWCAGSAQLVAKRKRITFYEGEDDGGISSSGIKLSTNNFTKLEVQKLSLLLNNKYNLMSTVISAGHVYQYVIYIPKRSIKLLSEIVKDYMHPSMMYKLNNY